MYQTGERPYVCSYEGCGKRFITKGHLKTHELIHTGDKPYCCDFCGKCYSRTGRLKIHMRTHVSLKFVTLLLERAKAIFLPYNFVWQEIHGKRQFEDAYADT